MAQTQATRPRQLAHSALSRYIGVMTENASIFDLVDDDAKKRAIAEARASVEAGRVVDHAVVAEWLEKIAAGERPAAPLSTRKP